MEKIIVRKTTRASKRPDVTLRKTWGHKNSDVSSMPRETESNLQTWKLWPSSIRESQLAGRGVTRTSSTCKELKNSSMMLSRRRISLPKISSKRSTRNNFEMIFEKLNWPILILHNWKGSIQRHHRKLRDWEGRSLRDACLGKPRSFHSQWLMKSQLMGQVPARKVKKDMEWEFSKGSEPRRRIEVFFCQDGHGVMNVDFSDRFSGFRTHVVVTTACTTAGVQTLTCCTHIFLHMARAQSHLHIFMRVTHTHGSSSWKKGVCRMSVLVLHLAFSLLMCHPSLLRPRWNLWLVWILCFARFSSWFWSSDRNQRKHASGNRLPEREREERETFFDQCCRVDVKERLTGVCVSLKSHRKFFSWEPHRKFFSDGRDLREHVERRAQQAIIGANSIPRKYIWMRARWISRIWSEENSDYALTESQRELESQRQQLLEANQSKLNVRENML